jgi:hypothetical protein
MHVFHDVFVVLGMCSADMHIVMYVKDNGPFATIDLFLLETIVLRSKY